MAVRKRKKVQKKRKYRQAKAQRSKVVVRKPKAAVRKKKAPAKKAPTKVVKKNSQLLRVEAINRLAEGQVICDLLMEHQINHRDMYIDQDFMTLHFEPHDAVAFYALFLNTCKKRFKDNLSYQYKTGEAEQVLVAVPVGIMHEMTKILTEALQGK